jgi:hypothetical protein
MFRAFIIHSIMSEANIHFDKAMVAYIAHILRTRGKEQATEKQAQRVDIATKENKNKQLKPNKTHYTQEEYNQLKTKNDEQRFSFICAQVDVIHMLCKDSKKGRDLFGKEIKILMAKKQAL